ncbi:MAG: hypothetical protein GY753_19600, partial [Gammaproteobacteria bacterium]|nr:hypothetical protein [Gammaproteobacteria bacterium]
GSFDPDPITSVAPASGGIGPVEYLWLTGECGTSVSTWTPIANSNSETYDPGYLTETTCFVRCSRNEGCTPWIGESNIITITVNPQPVATCVPVDGDCDNENQASASVSASGGTAPYTYLWSTGATTMSISNLTAGSYSVTVTDAKGCADECNVAVTTEPCCNVTEPGEIAANQENCGSFDPDPITSVAPASGGIGPVEYLWLTGECGTSVSTWTPIANSNSQSYDPGYLTETTCFVRCSRNEGCTPWIGESNIITITVNPQPVAT